MFAKIDRCAKKDCPFFQETIDFYDIKGNITGTKTYKEGFCLKGDRKISDMKDGFPEWCDIRGQEVTQLKKVLTENQVAIFKG